MYRSLPTGVKRARTPLAGLPGGIAVTLCSLAPGLGCAATKTTPNPHFRLAVRYDVESMRIGLDRAAGNKRTRTDLTRASELGFDAVVFECVEDDERAEMLEVASSSGLAAIVPDRDAQYYLLTGRLPSSFASVDDMIRGKLRGLSAQNGFAGLSIGRVASSPGASDRYFKVRAAVRELDVPCVVLATTIDLPCDGSAFAVVDAGELADDAVGSPLERLLARFHGELAAGRTAGLVVDRFARAPGDRAGLVTVDNPPTAAKLAAVQGLVRRAQRWGPRLFGCRSEIVRDASVDGEGVSLTTFVLGLRRYALWYNPSGDRYVRGSVAAPASIDGRPVLRLIEIPPTPDHIAGEVFESQRGGVTIRVDMRPGDGALFEVC
ncbi:MAG: hypothetical protein Q7R41_15290 [Phycisphaerales bacterium]|nr:hypothetical protein [Phycisphaerales bacterium]